MRVCLPETYLGNICLLIASVAVLPLVFFLISFLGIDGLAEWAWVILCVLYFFWVRRIFRKINQIHHRRTSGLPK
jgi:hypothetical protein